MAKKYIYKDINLLFDKHPLTGDIITATDVEAIKKSLKNLILTDLYEVPFNPEKGTSIHYLLFENFTPITVDFLKTKIKEMINIYEPRVEIQKIVIYQKEDDHILEVSISFKIIDLNIFDNLTVFVERTR